MVASNQPVIVEIDTNVYTYRRRKKVRPPLRRLTAAAGASPPRTLDHMAAAATQSIRPRTMRIGDTPSSKG